MIDPSLQLTIDDAMAEFSAMIDDLPLNGSGNGRACALPQETPQEADTRHFLLAQYLIGLACPAPGACGDPRCRRDGACRYLLQVRDRWNARMSSHPRRPPGADALRRAIWVYVASRRGGG
jgi:hypothetical protein